jgi:hypothetical protein
LNLHVLHPSVHARNTCTVFNSKVDETILAPARSPRVLNDPVVHGVFRNFRNIFDQCVSAAFAIGYASVVGLQDLTLAFARWGVGILLTPKGLSASSLILRFWGCGIAASKMHADNYDTVIDRGWAFVRSGEDTCFVPAPA